jgi:hypothetical protein
MQWKTVWSLWYNRVRHIFTNTVCTRRHRVKPLFKVSSRASGGEHKTEWSLKRRKLDNEIIDLESLKLNNKHWKTLKWKTLKRESTLVYTFMILRFSYCHTTFWLYNKVIYIKWNQIHQSVHYINHTIYLVSFDHHQVCMNKITIQYLCWIIWWNIDSFFFSVIKLNIVYMLGIEYTKIYFQL